MVVLREFSSALSVVSSPLAMTFAANPVGGTGLEPLHRLSVVPQRWVGESLHNCWEKQNAKDSDRSGRGRERSPDRLGLCSGPTVRAGETKTCGDPDGGGQGKRERKGRGCRSGARPEWGRAAGAGREDGRKCSEARQQRIRGISSRPTSG